MHDAGCLGLVHWDDPEGWCGEGGGRRVFKKKKKKKSYIEIYITICKIDSQWEFAVWLRKLKQGLCINLEGWDGEGDGWKVKRGGDRCTPMADSG